MSRIEETVARVRAVRRARGLNVVFRKEDGRVDEWSFRDAQQRGRFCERLTREGREFYIPTEGEGR